VERVSVQVVMYSQYEGKKTWFVRLSTVTSLRAF